MSFTVRRLVILCEDYNYSDNDDEEDETMQASGEFSDPA